MDELPSDDPRDIVALILEEVEEKRAGKADGEDSAKAKGKKGKKVEESIEGQENGDIVCLLLVRLHVLKLKICCPSCS